MEVIDNFDQIGQLSNNELREKFYKLRRNSFHNFLEESLQKSYKLYKRNKNSDISFIDYKDQLLKDLEKNKNTKKTRKN